MTLSVCPNPSIDCYAWISNFKPGGVTRIEELKEFPGGKGTHVALALNELGGHVQIFGVWAGATGEWIKKECSQKGVDPIGIIIQGNNRKCYTFLSSNAALRNTELLEPGPYLEMEDWFLFKKKYEKKIKRANIICLSGSWPGNAPGDAYFQLIQSANKDQKKVFLDCNGDQLKQALKTSFFGLHLNEEEAYALCGSSNFDVLVNKLKGKVELIALTKGKEGLMMRYKGKTIEANVKIENIVSTVGSGDCLTAGLIWGLEKNLSPEGIAAYGVACGAANCLNEDLGFIKKEDVENLLPKVVIKITE